MTHSHTRLVRLLMVPIPLLITACCLKNPKIYFSTGTTVGLEATPPTTETPPHVTFGYKRAELALIPVTKLDKQHTSKENPSQTAGTPSSGSAPEQPETATTSVSTIKREQSTPLTERGCSTLPIPTQMQNDGTPTQIKDAFSVLASFHLAVNWFGPAKIEQHFATGCAAANLIKGITEEEEDKRNAEEATSELNQTKSLLAITERSANRLADDADELEKKASGLKTEIEDKKNIKEPVDRMTKANDTGELKKTLKGFAERAGTMESAALRLRSETDALKLRGQEDPRDAEGIKPLADAKEKAHTAITKSDKSARNQKLLQQAQKTKDDASQLIVKINSIEPSVSKKLNEVRATLKRVLSLVDECRSKIVVPVQPKEEIIERLPS